MKNLNLTLLVIFFALAASVHSCKNDDDDEVSQYVGNYVIIEAQLSQSLVVPVSTGNFTLPSGTNITQIIQQALLSAVSCTSVTKSYIELRENFSMYMSCEGQNELNAGTWEEVSATSIKLNMNSTAIPSSPTGIVLTVTDIVKDASGLTGITSVPLPKAMIANIIAPLQLHASALEAYIVTFSIEFTEK